MPLEEQIENFWDVRAPLEGLAVSIRPPVIEMPLLKRLGEPSFFSEPGLQSALSAAYQLVSRKAIQIAFRIQVRKHEHARLFLLTGSSLR